MATKSMMFSNFKTGRTTPDGFLASVLRSGCRPAPELQAVKRVWVPFSAQAGSELGRSGHRRPRRPEIARFSVESQVSNSSS